MHLPVEKQVAMIFAGTNGLLDDLEVADCRPFEQYLYRFLDTSGRRQKYLELFNLKKGFRVNEFELFGRAPEKGNDYADTYSITASGLGGDPFPGGQIAVSKQGLYDLRINYRQSYYYWNRNDDQPNPGGLAGLSINHDWATVRKFGSVNRLRKATVEQIAATEGIGPKLAQDVHHFLERH